MTLLRRQTSEHYGALGTAVTLGNSGGAGSDAWTIVTPGATGSIVTDTGLRGTYAHAFNSNAASQIVNTGWDNFTPFTTGQHAYFGMLISRADFTPGSNNFFFLAQTGAGATTVARARVSTTGSVDLLNTASTQVWTSGAVLSDTGIYRVEFHIKVGATGGELECKVWSNPTSSGSPDWESTLLTGTQANNAADLSIARFGNTAANNSGEVVMDDMCVADTWPGYLGAAGGGSTAAAGDLIIARS